MAISVELFVSPVCDRCAKASKMMKLVVDEFGNDRVEWREVDVLDEIDYAVAIGVLSTPAIAIDGKLVFSSLPGVESLYRALQNQLNTKSDNAHEYLPDRRI
jgi:predicted DsbA family dithiol-disulfide isomerase